MFSFSGNPKGTPVRKRDRLLRDVLKESFAVTPKSGPMFSGLLVDVDDRTYVFANVRVLSGENGSVPADGRLYIDRNEVAYLQLVARIAEG
jgi:hypothetical protein